MLRIARGSSINLINKYTSTFTWKPGKTKYLYWALMKANGFSSCELSVWNNNLIDGKGKKKRIWEIIAKDTDK